MMTELSSVMQSGQQEKERSRLCQKHKSRVLPLTGKQGPLSPAKELSSVLQQEKERSRFNLYMSEASRPQIQSFATYWQAGPPFPTQLRRRLMPKKPSLVNIKWQCCPPPEKTCTAQKEAAVRYNAFQNTARTGISGIELQSVDVCWTTVVALLFYREVFKARRERNWFLA